MGARETLALVLLLLFAISYSDAEDDIRCLQGLKQALKDPQQKLMSWSFSESSIAFLCKFVGVTCWNERENRVLSLHLPAFSLSGTIPESLRFCRSIQSLDLSNNKLFGSIPSQICDWLPYIVTLDLSNNKLTGQIPSDLFNCKFLHNLKLDNNHLSGIIPSQISLLGRLEKFSVANNDLSGCIPSYFSRYDAVGFQGNDGLRGRPLGSKCGELKRNSLIIIIAAGVFGTVISLVLGFVLWWYWCFSPQAPKMRDWGLMDTGVKGENDLNWIKGLRAYKHVQVSMFQKPLVKIRLSDLMASSNNFDLDNVMVSNKSGTSYRGVLRDGSAIAIKRLCKCDLSEKQFLSEIGKLGKVRHPNLVPILGFCVAGDEKMLVYKHMPNGTLSSLLHHHVKSFTDSDSRALNWPLRLKIAIGVARGLTWLHHGYESPILHQNINPKVILIDDDCEARITEFGLANLTKSIETNRSTHINGDFGEFGYVAPEYSSTLVASAKGDVFAFGVVLLELATGKKPLEVSNVEEGCKGSLIDWVKKLSTDGKIRDAIEKTLCDKGHEDEIIEILNVACGCVTSNPKDRYSMPQVYHSLKTIGKRYDFSEHYEDFPQIANKKD